ncbi:hypothetical protein J4230_01855 [Candidatus Woesearchaeota archaeon]|nr:hypothetical protein [Candidatus Woesearchaeota archaeon]
MYFIKDKLTVKVFLLVVLLLVCMVSLLVVFSRNFEEINTKYQQKVAELNSTFENLTGTQKQLNKTITDLELKNIKEADLRDKYKTLKNERDSLDAQVNKLNADVAQRDKKINSLTLKVDSLEEEIEDLESKITKLDKRINCFKNGGTNC